MLTQLKAFDTSAKQSTASGSPVCIISKPLLTKSIWFTDPCTVMERPERPSRHKLNRVKIPFRPTFSSDSESEVNDNDMPIHITYYRSQQSESGGVTAGPSTSVSGQHISQNNTDTPSNNTSDFVPSSNTITLAQAEESQEEPQDQLDPIRRKRPATSSAASSVLFDSVDTIIGSSTSAQGPDSPERPANPSQPQRTGFIIRPRSFCHIDNTIRPPAFKYKRLSGPIDLTPSTSNRDTFNQVPVAGSIFGVRDSNILPSSSTTQNWLKRTSTVPFMVPPRTEAARSTILRHFDEMCPTSPVTRRRIRPSYTVRNSSLDDYCDLVGNFLFNCPLSDTNGPRSPERAGGSEPQTNTTADIINRHITTTPDLINHEQSSIINDINSYLDPQQQIRNNIEGGVEPIDQGSDDVIVVETPDINTSPESYMVPSSRTPSPAAPPPPPSSAATAHKQDKAQANHNKEVPMTLQELNQSLVSLLECPVCLDHATPPIYQCCKGHILCQSCHPRLTTCPICRSRLPGDRNSVMEKVAEKLMYPCKNTVTGCSQMLKLDDKQKHEEGCGFRHYACIITACHWKGYKPELVVHLQSNHPDKLISGAVKELHVPVPVSVPEGGSMLVTHHWIQSAHNEVFNVIFHVDLYKRIMKGCVIYIGSPEKAEKFSYVFELKQRVAPFRRLSYSRSTHADTLKPGQPLCLSNDFSINIDMARLYHDYVLHAIPVHISIKQEQ